jgi:23S rRNA (uracil1939-C5)-methyltransferase
MGSLTVSSSAGTVLQLGTEGVPILREDKGQLASGKVFSQANPSINQKLREVILSLAGGKQRVLELYAGSGNLTLPLLQSGANVLAVEADQEAAKWLRKNTRGEFAVACEVRQGEAAAIAKRLNGEMFDVVVLDPPRAGAAPTIEALPHLTSKIVYISCDLANLSRDVQTLQKKGFALKKIFPFDMFPQSAHIETVALLEAKTL